MHLLRRFGTLFLLAVLLHVARAPLQAQVPDVPVVDKPIARLKAALRQPITSATTADSLLTQARQLAYVPGQIVALSQLAGIRLQEQQPEQATALLLEAKQLAGQLHDMGDTGWTMAQLSRIQARFARTAPALTSYYAPLSQELQNAMSKSSLPVSRTHSLKELQALKEVDFNPLVFRDQPSGTKQKERGVGARPQAPDEPIIMPPAPNSPAFQKYLRAQLDPVDKWLDTLLAGQRSAPQVARRLAASRQLRDRSQALSKAAANQGDYAKAYQYFRQYTAYKDSLTAAATAQRLAALEYRQNLLKKEAQIQRLTRERTLREQAARRQQQFVLVLVGGIALLVGLAVMLIRNNRAKRLANLQLSEQKEALQQAMTELKTAQAQLIQAEKMASLGELTAGIAHEIQNPLNFVNNFSEVSTELLTELLEHQELATRDPELEHELLADVQQNLQKINQHGQRASAIVKGMLAHAGTSTGQKQPTDLNALASEYLQLAYHGATAKDKAFEAHLVTTLDPALPPALVVPQEISRVLLNVLGNAFYAVRQKQQTAGPGYQPEVHLRTQREGNQVKIQVRDNGNGVPAAIKQKVFQPFFTTKPTGEGTGLGLSLSYDIITKGHGGTFALESEEGQFTEVTLMLPLAS
jgi:two-component system NtrC family sensor kinase